MKTITIFLQCMLLITATRAQNIDSINSSFIASEPQEGTREYYVDKSNRQKTRGIILIAGSGALTVVAAAIALSATEDDPIGAATLSNSNFTGSLLIGLLGSGMFTLGVIDLVSAGKNKRKAELMLKNEAVQLPSTGRVTRIPSIGIKAHF